MTIFSCRFVSTIARLILAAAALTTARAQDAASVPESVHLSRIAGAVLVRHGDDGPWLVGAVDAPLTNNDHIATGPKGEADIQIDPANVFHAGSDTEIRMNLLESGRYRMAVIKGTITCHVGGSSTADVEVRTPSVTVRTSRSGVYLIAVNRSGESEITARAGDVEVVAPRGAEWVNAGQKMVARGPASDPQYKIGRAIPLWRRVAVIVGACMQIAGNISSSTSFDGGGHGSSGSTKTTAAAPAKPAAPTAPARPTAPSPPPHDGNRGKG